MTIDDCLPAELRGPQTTITKIAAGLSGAGVYRVESGGQGFVLKIAPERDSDTDWRRGLSVQRLAAGAGLTPEVVHVDEGRRAVLTRFVEDRSFPALFMNPATRQAALAQLGQVVRRIHALPIPADVSTRTPREFLAQLRGGLQDLALPDFAREAIERALAEAPPATDRAPVLSHNDLNPSNLIHDGQSILILDWAAAGVMDPLYDLAVLAVFFRMDQATCLRLLAAYDDQPVAALPVVFLYLRRMVAALAGTAGLSGARQLKHPGASGSETLADTLGLGDFYQQMRAGVLKLGTPEGLWAFGLALLKESLAY